MGGVGRLGEREGKEGSRVEKGWRRPAKPRVVLTSPAALSRQPDHTCAARTRNRDSSCTCSSFYCRK